MYRLRRSSSEQSEQGRKTESQGENMKVYVLLHNYDYEGASLVAVYRNEDTADKEAERLNATIKYGAEDYEVVECEMIED